MLTSLPMDFAPAARQARDLGFTHVDVVAIADRDVGDVEVLADTGLLVSCVAVGRGLPEGQTLDAASLDARQAALETMKRQIADAARLGATHCYLVPGTDRSPAGLARFSEACGLLANHAAGRMVRLCVEHVPGRSLPTVAAALAWLEGVAHNNLALLLDVGHCLISGEDAAEAVARAGARLGHVHLDDNDGAGDLHWPLLTGRLTSAALVALVTALQKAGYNGTLALELSPQSPDPVQALRQGKHLMEQIAVGR